MTGQRAGEPRKRPLIGPLDYLRPLLRRVSRRRLSASKLLPVVGLSSAQWGIVSFAFRASGLETLVREALEQGQVSLRFSAVGNLAVSGARLAGWTPEFA